MKFKSGISDNLLNFLMIILILTSVRMIFYFAITDFPAVISRVPDDASYYLKIALNFNEGKGFSFDGISRTSGFQPLWLYVLIIFTFIFKTSPETTLRSVMILQVILLFLSSLIFVKILRRFFVNEIVFAGGLIFTIFVYFQYLNGMETPLMILIFLSLFYHILKSETFIKRSVKKELVTGILLGLLMLARLDMVFFAIAILVYGIVMTFSENSDKRKDNIRSIFIIFSVSAVVTLPYLIFNLFYFGNIIPISGYLKSTVPRTGLNENISQLVQYREMIFGFLSVIYVFIYFFNIRNFRSNSFSTGLAVISAGNILLMLYIVFFMKWVIFPWYFSAFSIFFSFFICLIFKFILSLNFLNAGRIVFKILSAFIIIYWGSRILDIYVFETSGVSTWNVQSYMASQWVKKETESTDLFAMKDAGHFSYFSGREVINLDGLVNSFEFQEIIKNGKLNEYFKRHNLKYIAQHAIWERDDITEGDYETIEMSFISHRYSVLSDKIILQKKDEIYRSEPYFDGQYRTVFLIWKY
ncbi:MAG TPA: glycosyltransferase family 39 protein [Ignavibacteria bacterium]|nr:glycosyltransferase family 39 protein [Ignavibacteria bacterium]